MLPLVARGAASAAGDALDDDARAVAGPAALAVAMALALAVRAGSLAGAGGAGRCGIAGVQSGILVLHHLTASQIPPSTWRAPSGLAQPRGGTASRSRWPMRAARRRSAIWLTRASVQAPKRLMPRRSCRPAAAAWPSASSLMKA